MLINKSALFTAKYAKNAKHKHFYDKDLRRHVILNLQYCVYLRFQIAKTLLFADTSALIDSDDFQRAYSCWIPGASRRT